MTWPILSITQYLILSGIALFVICSNHEDGKKAYYDLRHILVALFWPMVLMGHGLWWLGKRMFADKNTIHGNEKEGA